MWRGSRPASNANAISSCCSASVAIGRAAIEAENRHQLERQRQFRAAADLLADAWSAFPEVGAVALIGSVARPLWKEVPRFREFRRAGAKVWHECLDLDLALWLDSQERLGDLRRAAAAALREARADGFGVSDHQLDVFLFEPGSDRYLGRLCHFANCPKGKRECLVPGCGDIAFNRRFPDFTPRSDSLRT